MITPRESYIIIHRYIVVGNNYTHEISCEACGKAPMLTIRHILRDMREYPKLERIKEFSRKWTYNPGQRDKAMQHYWWLFETQFKKEPTGKEVQTCKY